MTAIVAERSPRLESQPARHAPGGHPTRRVIALVATVGGIGTAISMTGSWIPSLWGDEAASVMSARRPLGSLLMMLTHVDAVHGTYYLGLHLWIRLFGLSPFADRFPSAIAIGVTAAGVSVLVGRFSSLGSAAAAGVFAAVMPQLTFAGEEVRAYAFDAMIATALAIVVAEILLRPAHARGLWTAYGVVLCVGIYVFLYLALMVAAVGLVLWLTPALRRHLRRWAWVSGIAVLAASPVIAFAIAERSQIAFLASRSITVRELVAGMWFGRYEFAIPAWALIALAVAGYVLDVRRARRAGRALGPRLEPLAVAWLLVPMGLVLATTPVMAGFTPRYATYSAPAAAVLMAFGVRRLVRMTQRLWIGAVVAAAVVALAVPIWAAQRGPHAMNHSDWNQIAATISADARPGDGIVFDKAARPSQRPILAMDTDPRAFRNVADLTVRIPFARNVLWDDEVYTVERALELGRFDGVRRVWMVQVARGRIVDHWGVRALESAGYHRVRSIREYASDVSLYVRS